LASKKKAAQKVERKYGDDRGKALETALAEIEKNFGKGAVMRLGETRTDDIPIIPTGSLGVDAALGVGGIPRGRIIEVFGPESSGKTTLALHIVAEVQKLGGIAGYIDAEHAMDPVYAKKLGVNIDDLYISQPDDGEQALDITESMVRSGAIDLVVVDSVAALVPRAEIEGVMGDSHMGLQARLMSQALRKLTAITNKTFTTIIFINQLRANIGGQGYGPAETTTGGRALKFYASVRIDIRKVATISSGDDKIGSSTKVKIAKNKVAPPFKTCLFDIMYGQGISKESELIDTGEELKLVKKSGAWFSYGDIRLGQGRENAKLYLKENPEISAELEKAIRTHYNLPTTIASFADTTVATGKDDKEKETGGKSGKKKTKNEPVPLDDDMPLEYELSMDDDEELDIRLEGEDE